ncbi:STAS domain-containing protein [Lipingzhangella sp. LS1_29]|uniref:Anti-sigma factor antagonist n=1 Tax=Lipingzhangella rawalii TaxID=2055835 RepID=A0ABU2H479_9ACTN|nr:STAS domain-containing protein [Lipingzhangella rawalii]MDS1270100.1 STAS domain-containing protein [Lipingzhangella rawalii]
MNRLGLNTRVENNSVIVMVEGELDIATADDLQGTIETAVNVHGPWLIIDLSGLEFMDSSGLNAVISAYRTVSEKGGGLALAAPNDRVNKVLRLVGLHRQVAVHPTVSAAVVAMEAVEGRRQAG